MEKLYRKLENGRYESVGYNHPDISDGIWLVQTKPNHRSISSLMWMVGEIKRPVDIVTHASMYSMLDGLERYIHNLKDENSEEYKEAKDIHGAWIQGRIGLIGISSSDLAMLIMRYLSIQIESNESM
jgi:hypothetical protein